MLGLVLGIPVGTPRIASAATRRRRRRTAKSSFCLVVELVVLRFAFSWRRTVINSSFGSEMSLVAELVVVLDARREMTFSEMSLGARRKMTFSGTRREMIFLVVVARRSWSLILVSNLGRR